MSVLTFVIVHVWRVASVILHDFTWILLNFYITFNRFVGFVPEINLFVFECSHCQESIKIVRSTIDAKSQVYGDLSAEVADTWKLIGSIHMSQGDTEKGLRSFKKVR